MSTSSATASVQAPSLQRLAIHTITTKPWSLREALEHYRSQHVQGISIWVEALESTPPSTARRWIDDAGMHVPALVRGGFFCDRSSRVRQSRIDENRKLIEIAAEVGAESLVLVVGATPGVELQRQRGWVEEGVQTILADAAQAGLKLAVEPLHPMYAADKSCINRLREARLLCDQLNHPLLGVAIDVYHTWWDPDLHREIELLGKSKRIFGFHLCDWRVPTRHLLTDRALMGDGCIHLKQIRLAVEAAGFTGWNEVEIFSEEHWATDQKSFLNKIVERYAAC